MQAIVGWWRPSQLLTESSTHFTGLPPKSRHCFHGVSQNFSSLFPLQTFNTIAFLRCQPCALKPCLASPYGNVPNPADEEPLEVDDEADEKLTKFDKIWRESQRIRKQQEADYELNKDVYLEAIGLDSDGDEEEDEAGKEGSEIAGMDARSLGNDDFFSAVDSAMDLVRKDNRASEQPTDVSKSSVSKKVVDEGEEQEGEREQDAEEIAALRNGDLEYEEDDADREDEEEDDETEEDDVLADPSFDLDFTLEEEFDLIREPTFRMTLSELLDEARVVPILVDGDQDVEITGIQHDSRQVGPGNMFVCCPGQSTDGHLFLAEAAEKGAEAIVASKEVSVLESVKAVVLVEDTNSILSALSAAFYGHPSKKLSVVGITGTDGKTTTSYLLKSMYEAMGHKTGLLGSVANYVNGKKKVDASIDAVSLQRMMATMVHNGTDVCVMEVSSDALALDRCKEVDFDIAVFTNLTRDDMEHKESKARLFAKMVDPQRHVKVVNIDDDHAPYFIAQGNPDVPVVTLSMENREADVFALEIHLSLFETDVLVRTPRGNVEISSGLLGRHNVYNILTAVAVGIAVDAPLEEIVRGVEEVDAVPGRCELIDEEQAFAVIVDHARTPYALSRLLDTIKDCGARRIITVVGCEGESDRGKRPVMAKIATEKSDVSILTSDNPRTEDPLYILDDMLAGVGWSMKEYLEHGEKDYYPPLRNGHRLFVYDVRPIAVRAAVAMGEEGDAVVIAGKGHEAFQVIGNNAEYLDDREECREALQHVDALHAAGIDTSEFPWRLPESH